MSSVVGEDGEPETVVVLEGNATADAGEDIVVPNDDGPALRLIYDGKEQSITARELISYWSKDIIYLGFGGRAAGQPKYSLITFVQRSWSGSWLIHYQLSRHGRQPAQAR